MGALSFFQPSPGADEPCPICGHPRPRSDRYPDHVCADCVARAVDEDARPLRFFNTSMSGAFAASYVDTGEPRDSNLCFIDGVRCRADEARFGGIVVRPEHS
jgi:hypothetical protein